MVSVINTNSSCYCSFLQYIFLCYIADAMWNAIEMMLNAMTTAFCDLLGHKYFCCVSFNILYAWALRVINSQGVDLPTEALPLEILVKYTRSPYRNCGGKGSKRNSDIRTLPRVSTANPHSEIASSENFYFRNICSVVSLHK